MTRTTKRKAKEVIPARPEPSVREQVAIEAAKQVRENLPCRPRYQVESDEQGTVKLVAFHSDDEGEADRISAMLSSRSPGFQVRSLIWLLNAAKSRGEAATSDGLGAALAFVSAIEPRDELEAAIAMQMYATHEMAMDMMFRARQADLRPAVQEYGNLATKMARTFTAQVEALSKLRRGGEQVVRHIHVDNRGGQAVIAETVNTGGASIGKIADQPHGEGASVAALLGSDPAGYGVPVPGDAEWPLPDSRREVARRAKG